MRHKIDLLTIDNDYVLCLEDLKQRRELIASSDEELLKQAQKGFREFKRLKRLWRAGEMPACTIPAGEMLRLKEEFFARGGTITKLPPGAAKGAVESQRWGTDWNSKARRVEEQLDDADVEGSGLSRDEVVGIVSEGMGSGRAEVFYVWREGVSGE